MELDIYQVDAFSSDVFGGNPAAICPLDNWISEELMQSIAAENNLSETAFLVRSGPVWNLRWFTPVAEVDLCGHATLAAAHVLFESNRADDAEIVFLTRSGELRVERTDSGLTMNFPALEVGEINPPDELIHALQVDAVSVHAGMDYLVELASPDAVSVVAPDMSLLGRLDRRGVIVTATGYGDYDFVSRFFAPSHGIPEDPVTGSAHCALAPFWMARLNKVELRARQMSARGGDVKCQLVDDRVFLTGSAVTFMQGRIRTAV